MPPPVTRRGLRPATTAVAFLLATVALGILAGTGRLDPLDDAVAELVRPGDSWGDLQVRVDPLVEGLRPVVAAGLALAASAVAAWRDRTARPLVLAAAALAGTAGLTWLLQGAFGRPDPHGFVAGFDGSYPSGHTVVATVAAGLVAAALLPGRPRAVAVAAVVAGLVMGTALVVQVAHWATDVLGGLLLATGLLTLLGLFRVTAAAPRAGHDG